MSHENPTVLERLVNEELTKVSKWLINNQLTLNLPKSCYLFFSGKKNNLEAPKFSISGSQIQRLRNTKYLGVPIDDKLDWKAHLEHLL